VSLVRAFAAATLRAAASKLTRPRPVPGGWVLAWIVADVIAAIGLLKLLFDEHNRTVANELGTCAALDALEKDAKRAAAEIKAIRGDVDAHFRLIVDDNEPHGVSKRMLAENDDIRTSLAAHSRAIEQERGVRTSEIDGINALVAELRANLAAARHDIARIGPARSPSVRAQLSGMGIGSTDVVGGETIRRVSPTEWEIARKDGGPLGPVCHDLDWLASHLERDA
jgi:hypothetical protein